MGVRQRFRRRVPTMLQMEATECGAASLGMVMSSYGRYHPIEELRVACGVARDGSTAQRIVQAARSYGLKVRAFRKDPEQLKELAFPLIVHWRFAHFLVVEGWYPGGWFLNDPAMGPRRCDNEEFDESFTGVVLEVTPGEEFTPHGQRPGVVGRLRKAAGRINPMLLAVAIIGLLLVIPTLLVPGVVRIFGDGLTGAVGLAVSAAVIGLLIAVLVQLGLFWLQGNLSVKLASKISVRLGATMVHRLLRLPASFHSQRGASALAQRALLVEQLSIGVTAVTVSVTTGVLTSVTAAVVLFFVDWLSGVFAAVIGIATALVLQRTMVRSRDEAARLVHESIEVGSVFASSLAQIEPIKASGTEDGIIAKGLGAGNRLLEAQQRIGVQTLSLTLIPGVLTGGGLVLIAAAAAWQVRTGATGPGTFLAVIALAGVVIAPLGQIVVALDQAQTLRATLDQVDDVLGADEDPELARTTPTGAPSVIVGDLRLSQVTFGYSPRSDPVVTDLDLHLRPGHRVALVGPSGCGKSTVSRLVTGLYPPWSGEVLIDGLPRSAHAHDVLVDRIALVDQDVTIFAGTIRDNVTLWDKDVSDHDVLAALEDAQLADVVAGRTGGLDAVLTEGGSDLSGGQRQRLEIARALVRNPSLLVMDEATSALDPITEQRIDMAIRRRGISVLVIAHRLSTIRDSDEIIMLRNGRVVERGTHAELMNGRGAYHRLVGSQ
jgi:NHLM bacteriocin system ABC transporter peptidase/ATP-binding protein